MAVTRDGDAINVQKPFIRGISAMTKRSMQLFTLGVAALMALAAPSAPRAADFKPAGCVDTTPHKVRMVRVAPGVELEVIDWGGTGKPMVLLTGLGDNAHVYDQFAYQFTDYFHVYGITRRGFLPSSQPRDGYDVPTRVRDDIAVLDALGIKKAVFAGHSLAGSELSRLGADYKERVDKLVYLDASDLAERFKPSRTEPPGAQPLFTPATLKSLEDYQAASARIMAIREPNPAVCLNLVFNAKGEIVDFHLAGLDHREASSRGPRIGQSADELGGGQGAAARDLRHLHPGGAAGLVLVPEPGRSRRNSTPPGRPIAVWFKQVVAKFADGNQKYTYTLPGAPHYVYINHEAEVVRWMREFLGIPPKG